MSRFEINILIEEDILDLEDIELSTITDTLKWAGYKILSTEIKEVINETN